ncbi:MAG: PEP-CTERM sorting domain-containing protein [Anaerohalosphaeraceae bacterium]
MKKLVSLVLVLGMASMASAGIQLVVLGPDTIGIESSDTLAWSAVIGWSAQLDVIAEGFTEAGQGGLTSSMPYGVQNGADLGLDQLGMVYLKALAPAGTPTDMIEAGIQYTVKFANVPGFGTEDMGLGRVDLISEDLGTILQTFYVIPEPASMLLLGLGGLFLRRK